MYTFSYQTTDLSDFLNTGKTDTYIAAFQQRFTLV